MFMVETVRYCVYNSVIPTYLFSFRYLLIMDVDWIVGIMVFLVFVGWAFSYYFALFEEEGSQFGFVAEIEREKIMDFLSADVYEAPVKYDSPDVVNNGVLKAKSVWYSGEKNSTRVFSGDQSLPCRVSGDDLYWEADLASGSNYFRIQIADVNETMNCTGTFGISSFNLTIPWAFEKRTVLSLTKMNEMENTEYEAFRGSLGLNEDFRIKAEKSGGDTEYGKSIPEGAVNVNSKESRNLAFETSEIVNVTIAIW